MAETILVVDDEPSIRHAIVRAFADLTVREAEDGKTALLLVKDAYPDLVLLDQRLPDGDGLELIARIHAIDPDLPVVLLTGHGSVDLAVDALKLGVADFIEKPFKLERLRHTVGLLLEKQRLGRQVARLSGKATGRVSLVAHSSAMKRVMALVKRVAGVPGTTVLIQGESGVGKELVARAIHERSSRVDKNFVAINCAALSENLLEAELFGYEKGAFTGADSKGKAGLFEVADGGTIFLDEVGEMPLQLQTKLLRALQERRFRRVGGLQDVDVDVRVVAATNRDLRQEVAAGRFRRDLYYRLRVVPLNVPPLRDRTDDILPLADHLLKRLAPELGRPGLKLATAARAAMVAYPWPGNVRELANAVERAVIAAEGEEITSDDLCMDEELPLNEPYATPAHAAPAPVAVAPPAPPALPKGALLIPPGERNLSHIEALVVRAALDETGGQKSKAAELLGINRTTLYNKLRELGLMPAIGEAETVEAARTP
ncbi:MAG: sigma-54-dependent Fis family transcriptional regulator [Planctomycetes bacterium]|nr:sigma-54-dependent Fis family transcriptional regulator [Planctomycetota bacterium]